jgi:hypothetical protein
LRYFRGLLLIFLTTVTTSFSGICLNSPVDKRGFAVPPPTILDKALEFCRSIFHWAGVISTISKAADVANFGKTAKDSMDEMNARSQKVDSAAKGITSGKITDQQIMDLDNARLNADKQVVGPPARAGKAGCSIPY